ncbi:MAG TPA: metalloregulator ArsR/SmtB family transcription factor [Pyrinomonadaceae bacterium]|jgi:predicted ArsR family transcriptional regulator
MTRETRQTGERKTRRAIVKLLKTEGPLGSAQLAERLGLTAMAVRLHLYALQGEGLVAAEDRPVPVGRPAKSWRLTREADRHFPEAYAELSVALLDAMQETFGAEGLNRVLVSRCARQRAEYAKRIRAADSLEKRLKDLAQVRTEEGYMAEVKADAEGGGFLLVENHCPICAAANACQGFCSTELDLFRTVLGPGVEVERVEHIVSGDQRCAYRVLPATRARKK